MKGDEEKGFKLLLVIVLALLLFLIVVIMHEQIFDFVYEQGKQVIIGINKIIQGKPPWLN